MNNKILIVDDDPHNIFALELTLKVRGYQVKSCIIAKDAIEILKKDNSFDVVLMDVMMPEVDGYEAIKAVKDTAVSGIPVIAVTAKAMPEDRQKCLDAGAQDYISKPINVDLLITAIEKLL